MTRSPRRGRRTRWGHLGGGGTGRAAGLDGPAGAARGRLGLATVLAPAIRYDLPRGFAVSPYLALSLRAGAADLARYPASAKQSSTQRGAARRRESTGAPGMTPAPWSGSPPTGRGPSPTARSPAAVAADMARHGGLVTVGSTSPPTAAQRSGPPCGAPTGATRSFGAADASSGGMHLVQALNRWRGFDVGALGAGSGGGHPPAGRDAEDRVRRPAGLYRGDPAEVDVPVEWLTSKAYADARASEIGPIRLCASRPPTPRPAAKFSRQHHPPDGDGRGTARSWPMTQTLKRAVRARSHRAGDGDAAQQLHAPDRPHPGRPTRSRRASASSPACRRRCSSGTGDPGLVLGTPGGRRIFAAVLQGVLNVIDHGMSPQEAVDAPRVWTDGGALEVEGMGRGREPPGASWRCWGTRCAPWPASPGG